MYIWKAQKDGTDKVPRSLNVDGRLRVASVRPRLVYPREINPLPFEVETLLVSEPVWTFQRWEDFFRPLFEIQFIQTVSLGAESNTLLRVQNK